MRTTYRILMIILAVSCFLLPTSLLAKSITQTTTNKKFSVTMTTPEDGLSVGKNSISLTIYDADDYEVVGAIVNVKPWMPGMGHGVFLEPNIEEKNNGVYEIDNVGISMPGHWQLVVSVKTDSIFDQTTFEFQNITGEMGAGCTCGPDCKCEHCTTGKGPCACKVGGKGTGCTCGPDCKCEHCTTGKGPCACKAGSASKCNMKDGKCIGNCSCGCKEGKPCQMKDGKCIGGCGCGCQAANIPNCKCGPGCTTLINCTCGADCKCAMDGKDGCGCTVGCRPGCPNGACPLSKKTGTS